MMTDVRMYLWGIIKEFRFSQHDKFDLEFDYEEFFDQTLDKILEEKEE